MACFSAAQSQSTPAAESGSGLKGIITVGPAYGGAAKIGVPDSKPLANASFLVKKEDGSVAASFITDDQGRFRISLVPGHYTVSLRDKRPKVGRYGPFDVDVVRGQVSNVAWQCDSGMR